MGTVAPLFDTNILIDYLKGIPLAITEIDRSIGPAISVISWMEVMAGGPQQVDRITREFLSRFKLLPITIEITEQAVVNRRVRRLKLPDAIILATAQVEGRVLITRNTRDFSPDHPGIRIPYRL